MVASFVACLLGFLAVGCSAAWRSRRTTADYYVAEGGVPPLLVGLSAVATNNSGYMFIGAIGYTYVTGLASLWLMVGWISGDLLASLLVMRQLRAAAARTGAISYVGLLSQWLSPGGAGIWRRVAAVLVIAFLLAYTSAQFFAGSKALQVMFGWPLWAGAVMGAAIAVLYCFAGGIRASIWTDVAQSCLMLAAMGLLLQAALGELGGPRAAWADMAAIEGFLAWFPADLPLPGAAGAVAFVVGWLFAGLSVIGQPHIMVRYMALDDVDHLLRARLWYYAWFTLFYALAIAAGMLSRVLLEVGAGFDEELALPTLAVTLLSAPLAGLVLAGIFAATMSTADSLILSCSAALSDDLMPSHRGNLRWARGSTVLMTGTALSLALVQPASVFALVILAWSGLASAFVPLLLVLALGRRPRVGQALLMMLGGLAVAVVWRALGWQASVYEGLPGIVTGVLVYVMSAGFFPADDCSRMPRHRSVRGSQEG